MENSKNKYQIKKLSRLKILSMARLHCLCHIMSNLPVEDDSESPFIWTGDFQNGEFQYSDGLGNDLAIKWNSKNLVLVVFDHESPRSHFVDTTDPAWVSKDVEGTPKFFFEAFPSDLKPLLSEAKKLLGRISDPNITSLLWTEGDNVFLPESFDFALEHGLWMAENYLLNYEQAVVEGNDVSQPWCEIYSLSAEQQDMVVMLAQDLENSAKIQLSKQQWQDFITLDSSWADYKTGRLERLTNESISKAKIDLSKFNIFYS